MKNKFHFFEKKAGKNTKNVISCISICFKELIMQEISICQ
ncbi:hypothetical protein HMPREF0557_00594 [Listeria innocua ATCC 33091]|uniref:Uncharacterized protein n=1 Tax=Listeria innocua ATCC 33091 TaxID=1002366 RepID=A0AB72ZD44_LISIO|nr:hypothetical protein HMPREF0557_00594 [Listeria innocua ATCC 33091]